MFLSDQFPSFVFWQSVVFLMDLPEGSLRYFKFPFESVLIKPILINSLLFTLASSRA